MKLIGKNNIPDPDTTGDWLRRMGDPDTEENGLKGLDNVRQIINQRILGREGIKEYTLDVDATEITGEKEEAKYTYKGNKGYMPMIGYLYENGLCIYDEYREGNVSPGYGHKDFYLECKKRMPEGKLISYYRADSASYQAELINQLEKDGVKWAITANQDIAVKGLISGIPEKGWREPVKGCGYKTAEAIHSMEKTDKAFRLVIKREEKGQLELFDTKEGRYRYHVIATNCADEEKDADQVLKWHNQRGQSENFNKEIKIGFGMEYMPCGQTYANAVYFRIGVIAYNLFIGFKRLSCPLSWARHTIATIRWKMVQVAGKIIRHAGNIILKLSLDAKRLELFKGIRQRCFELSLCPDG